MLPRRLLLRVKLDKEDLTPPCKDSNNHLLPCSYTPLEQSTESPWPLRVFVQAFNNYFRDTELALIHLAALHDEVLYPALHAQPRVAAFADADVGAIAQMVVDCTDTHGAR